MIFGPYVSSILRLLLPRDYEADLVAAESSLKDSDTLDDLLMLGKVLLCAGKVKQARKALSRAEAAATEVDARALVGGYRRLTEFADFGACRDWSPGSSPLEVERRWSLLEWAIERDFWCKQLPVLSASVEQEVWFVTQIAPLVNELASASTPDESKPLFRRMAQAVERLQSDELSTVIALGVLLVHALMLRLVDQRAVARQFALRGIAYCQGVDHAIGEGLFALLVDDLDATARTAPEALDLLAGDVKSVCRSVMDELEEGAPSRPPEDWTSVFKGKSRARSIFESQKWQLGVGAALALAASRTMRAKPADMPATFEIRHLVEAQSAFQRAGDETGLQLVQCRLLISAIEQNYPFEEFYLQKAHSIGEWGLRSGGFSFALGLGYLFLAAGRRWRRRGDLASGIRAAQLAAALFDGLQASVAGADVAAEEAELIASGWESSQGIPAMQRAFDGYVEALNSLKLSGAGRLEVWLRLRQRVAQTGAMLLAWSAGRAAFARTRQRLLDLNVLPGAS
jgi:hypothetical protein